MAKNVVENFHSYCAKIEDQSEEGKEIQEDHFSIFPELKSVYQKKGDQIFYQFLNKVYDSNENQIMNLLHRYLTELVNRKTLEVQDFTGGVSKFLKNVPDLTNDYPKLTTYLSNTLYTLHNLNALKWQEIVWYEPPTSDEDAPFVEQYYHLMARFLILLQKEGKNWKEFYQKNDLQSTFTKMKEHLMQDNIFEEIEEELSQESSSTKDIVALLKG